jgi:hypothetical protein
LLCSLLSGFLDPSSLKLSTEFPGGRMSVMPPDNNLISNHTSETMRDVSFEEALDTACGRLMDRQIRRSLQRLQEMEERLNGIERGLDEFLSQKGARQ